MIATKNPGKAAEFRTLLSGIPVTPKFLSDLADVEEVEETGTTFEENAKLKAATYARRFRIWTIADDSGLEIDALGGAPGVYSARYGGVDMQPADQMRLVLSQLADTPPEKRSARFRCVMAIADSGGDIVYSANGECPGMIAANPRGSGGFGYDPIFIPDGFSGTFGELPDAVKQQISHRARATSLIIRYLLRFNEI